MSKFSLLYCCISLIFYGCKLTLSVSLEADLTLTQGQKQVLDEFKDLVIPVVPHDYMKKDIYLVRWLRAAEFNLQLAEEKLLNNLKWRQENRMDTILDEDWSDMEDTFVYDIEGYDTDGKPVAYFDLTATDFRKIVLTGKMERAVRFMDRFLEEITTKVRKLQEEGKNVTQHNIITNLLGANIRQHGCLQCFVGYTRFTFSYENHYPGSANKFICINTPRPLEALLQALQNVMSPETRESMEVYGTNKEEWQRRLFSFISRDQLPTDIGGTKTFDS